MAELTKKALAMREDPELFKGYLEAVKRAQYLTCTICLCDSRIELYVFKPDRMGIDFVQTFKKYDGYSLRQINKLLDKQADTLKERWLWSYEQLNNSESEDWALDLTQKDYAVLEVGSTLSQMQFCRMRWCFEDCRKTAQFIADLVNPDPEALEIVRRKVEVFNETRERNSTP